MKKIIALLFLIILSSCTTNYYYVTVNEDTPLYKTKEADGSPEIIIPANTQGYINGDGATYRQIKYRKRKLRAINPNYTCGSNYQNSTSSRRTSSSGNYSSTSSSSSGKMVHVKGYTRKDGTHVRPHTRSSQEENNL